MTVGAHFRGTLRPGSRRKASQSLIRLRTGPYRATSTARVGACRRVVSDL